MPLQEHSTLKCKWRNGLRFWWLDIRPYVRIVTLGDWLNRDQAIVVCWKTRRVVARGWQPSSGTLYSWPYHNISQAIYKYRKSLCNLNPRIVKVYSRIFNPIKRKQPILDWNKLCKGIAPPILIFFIRLIWIAKYQNNDKGCQRVTFSMNDLCLRYESDLNWQGCFETFLGWNLS